MPAGIGAASGLAGRYATALFDLAKAQDALPQLEADLESLRSALAGNAELTRALRSPVVRREEHAGIVAALGEPLGLSPLTRNFLGVLAGKRRLGALPAMLDQLEAMMALHRGEATAEVVSASPLSEEQLDRVRESVAAKVGRAVKLTAGVDPGLIGGLVVRVGSQMIDASLKTKLQQLELAMRGVR